MRGQIAVGLERDGEPPKQNYFEGKALLVKRLDEFGVSG